MIIAENILKNRSREIKYLFHISDIHIHCDKKKDKRRDEYEYVFKKLYKSFVENGCDFNDSLIIITGDILQTKDCDGETIKFTKIFFINLNNIAPVIIIPGNHDMNTHNPDDTSTLETIIDNSMDYVYYLSETGFYMYNNIIFGVTSVIEEKVLRQNKISDDFLESSRHEDHYYVSLYHGQLSDDENNVKHRLSKNKKLLSDFDGYDYVLLGDIHKHYFIDKHIAYAGSLIQQSYGENLRNHGDFQNHHDLTFTP